MLDLLHLPVYLDPILVGAGVSLATILVVSRLSVASGEEQAFLARLSYNFV